MALRNYQKEAIESVVKYRNAGVQRQLVVMATGLGKMVVTANLPAALERKPGEQIVFLAHRNELIDQAARQFEKFNPHLAISVDRAQYRADLTGDIVVSSVPSIGRTKENGDFNDRLKLYNPERIRYVLIDEAHRFVGNPMFLAPLRYFRVYKGEPDNLDETKFLYANTATPNRTDGLGLQSICDKIVFTMDLRSGIEHKWLADLKGYRVETTVSLEGVSFSHGDFKTSEIELCVNTEERNALVVEKYRELGEGKPGIAFTVDVQHSHDLAIMFRKHNIRAMPISGKTPEGERKRLLKAHKSGEVKILVSAGVLNEGVDVPWATVGLLSAPTASQLLYAQRIGRMSRLYPAPEEGAPTKCAAIIIDFVDISSRHRLITAPSLFGLDASFDLEGTPATKALAEIEEAQEEQIDLPFSKIRSLAQLRSIVEHVELIKPEPVAPEIRRYSKFSWMRTSGEGYYIALQNGQVLSIRPNALEHFDISSHTNGVRRLVAQDFPTLASALEYADALIPFEDRAVLRSVAKWHDDPPTQSQILTFAKLDRHFFRKFATMADFEAYIMANWTKGELSKKIRGLIAKKELQ